MADPFATLKPDERALLRPGPVPGFADPMKATLTDERFSDPDWIYERKLDGIRCLAIRGGDGVELYSRNDLSQNSRYPELVDALNAEEQHEFVVDGEVVAFTGNRTDFGKLTQRHRLGPDRVRVFYYVFDVLYVAGNDTTQLPQRARKAVLKRALAFHGNVRYTPHRNRDGEAYYEHACRNKWEGLIAKRANAPYVHSRSHDWLKFKCAAEQELVIGGYTDPKGSRTVLGALLVGYYERQAPPVRRQGRHRLRPRHAERPRQPPRTAAKRHEPLRRRGQGARGDLGRARARGPGRVLGVDRRRPPAPPALPRPARRQGGSGGGARVTEIRSGRRNVAISNPDKVLFPDPGYTKLDLAEYYARVAPVMLPHVRDRPMNLHVFPQGVDKRGFFLQDIPDHFPDWIGRITVPKRGGTVTHAVAHEPATLPYMAGQNVITPHLWSSRIDKLDYPDHIVMDLDPSTQDFDEIRAAAREAGAALRDKGLQPFAMVTGSRGIHVLAPLRRTADYDRVREFARTLAEELVEAHPDKLTLEHRVEKRGDRLYVDVLRNAKVHTVAAPYSVRPKPGAPVATPLRWEELDDPKLSPQRWNIKTLLHRLDDIGGDPWADVRRHARALPR